MRTMTVKFIKEKTSVKGFNIFSSNHIKQNSFINEHSGYGRYCYHIFSDDNKTMSKILHKSNLSVTSKFNKNFSISDSNWLKTQKKQFIVIRKRNDKKDSTKTKEETPAEAQENNIKNQIESNKPNEPKQSYQQIQPQQQTFSFNEIQLKKHIF